MRNLILAIIIIVCTACPDNRDWDNTPMLHNNTGKDIYFWLSIHYPDTSLNYMDKGHIYANDVSSTIEKGDAKYFYGYDICDYHGWSTKFYLKDTIVFLVFDKMLFDTTDWDYIVERDLVQRYYCTQLDLSENDCAFYFDRDFEN